MSMDVIGSEKDELLKVGFIDDEITNLTLLTYKTFLSAQNGDIRAIKYIFSYIEGDHDIFAPFNF